MSGWDIEICRANNGKWYADIAFDPDMMSTYRALINLDDPSDVPLSVDAGEGGGYKFAQPGFVIDESYRLNDPKIPEGLVIKAVRLWHAKAYLEAWGKASEEGERTITPPALRCGESWNNSAGRDQTPQPAKMNADTLAKNDDSLKDPS